MGYKKIHLQYVFSNLIGKQNTLFKGKPYSRTTVKKQKRNKLF